MSQSQPERPAWQVRISAAASGPGGEYVEANVPSGGGVWVGGRWVLTCAHVIGSEPRAVMVRFSFAGGEPITAVVTPHGWLAGGQGDLALLELDRDPPRVARPAPLRPARGVTGHRCAAYGYPAGHNGGVWSQPMVTGQTVDQLQLTAQQEHGHQIEKGFSGTGLVDTETGAVVGLVVTRDKGTDVRGGFAIPLQAVASAFPQLGPWVGWRLGTDRFVRQHWRPRARGVYEDTTPGWYFTGRTALLGELTVWLERGAPDRAVRVVTGPPGTGKSAVLAWLCALSDPQLRAEIAAARPATLIDTAAVPAPGRVSAAVWARGLDADGAAGALAAALMLPVTPGAALEDVLAAIRDLDPVERASLVVVLDALDEAKAAREIARRLLLPLARDLGVKVLTGTRPGRDGELLAALGQRAVVYRLDDPAWFDRHDLADYAAACLRGDFDPALPSGYRTDDEACGQVAEAIAAAAGSNFLVAGLAARARADEPVIDVRAPGWPDRQRFPAEVGQAFDDYLSRFGDQETPARDLLRGAAYAEGAGLPVGALWADIASALAAPRRYSTDDLAWLLGSAAAYLVESGGEHGQLACRIFHQALIEHLRPPDKENWAQREITSALIAAVPRTADGLDWAQAPPYLLGHLAAHAAAGGQLDKLVEDPGFLVAADPSGLLPVLDSVSTLQASQIAWFYRTTADRVRTGNYAERAAYLQLAAGKAGLRQMADALGAAAMSWLWVTRVLAWRSPGRYTALGITRPNSKMAITVTPRGEVLVVTGGGDGVVALWRLGEDGMALAGDPQPSHHVGGVRSVAVGQLGGQAVAVTGGEDGTVALWRLGEDGMALAGDPQPSHRSNAGGSSGGVRSVAVGQFGGQAVVVTGGEDGMVALWRLGEDGLALAGNPQPSHVGEVRSVAVGQLGGQAVAVTGGGDGMVALWKLGEDGMALAGDPQPGLRNHLGGSSVGVRSVAVGQLNGQAVAVTSSRDEVALWQLGEGGLASAGDPQRDHSGIVFAVAVGQLDDEAAMFAGGSAAVVTGGFDGTVGMWHLDAYRLAPAGDPQRGHGGGVLAAAVGQLGGQTVAVTSAQDGTVALWRLGEVWLAPPAQEPSQSVFGMEAVAVGQLGGHTVAVTGRYDGMVALWRLGEDGLALAGDPQSSHNYADVQAVAVGQLGGHTVAVTGGEDGMVALWRLGEDGLALAGDPQPGHHDYWVRSVAIGQLGGHTVAITGGEDGTVALWRLGEDGLALAGDPQPGHHGGGVRSVAIGQLDGQAVAVTGGGDGMVALWKLGEDGLALAGAPQPGLRNDADGSGRFGVRAVAIGQLGGQTVAATGAEDGTVVLWHLDTDRLINVSAACIPVGSPVIAIGLSPPATMIIWCRDGVLTAEMRTSRI